MITQYTNIPFEIFTIDHIFTENQLQEFNEFVKKESQCPNRPFTQSNFINGKLVHPMISNQIYRAIKPYLPNHYQDQKNQKWEYVDSIQTIMYAVVNTNQNFGIHTDTGYEFDSIKHHYSKYTVLVYLNDSFEGGTTTFYSKDFKPIAQIQPKTGRVLCFDIDLFHSGDPILKGSKRWIGTELICHKI